MFRKIAIATLAALALTSTAVLPLQAYPHHQDHYRHVEHRHVEHRHTGPYQHRMFGSWAQANGWMLQQRQLGFDCYYEWHGPQCYIYYR